MSIFLRIILTVTLLAGTALEGVDDDEQLRMQEERIRRALENPEFRKLHDLLGGSLPKVEVLPTAPVTQSDLDAGNAGNIVKNTDVEEIAIGGNWASFLRSELSRIDKMIWNRLYNIENAETVGFKEVVYEFTTPLPTFHTQSERVSQVRRGDADTAVPVRLVMTQGTLERTGQELDVAIVGDAFLALTDPKSGETLYTRDGRLTITDDGQLALSPSITLSPPLTLPPNHRRLVISQHGKVWSHDTNSNEVAVGTLPLVAFRDPSHLIPRGDGTFIASTASGAAVPIDPIATGTLVRQGFLERSNVELEQQQQWLERLHEYRAAYLRMLER